MLELHEVTTTDGLEALTEEWDALLDRSPHATPFQSPAWLLAWWRAMGGGDLHVTTLRHGGRLVALAPFFIYGAPGEERHLAFLGAGVSDYEDVLVEPALAEEGTALLLRHAAELRDRWDVATVGELHAASPLRATALATSRPHGDVTLAVVPAARCAVLQLPADPEALEPSLSWRFRRRLRNARNRLARAGSAKFVMADEATLPALLDALFDLHTRRWEERGESGVLVDARLRAFHERASAAFQRRGWLRFHALMLDGAPVAALYGFRYRDRAYMYLSGLDPDANFYSPGVLILEHAVRHAIAEGAREFDMLRGTESYKDDWTPEWRENVGLRLQHARATAPVAQPA